MPYGLSRRAFWPSWSMNAMLVHCWSTGQLPYTRPSLKHDLGRHTYLSSSLALIHLHLHHPTKHILSLNKSHIAKDSFPMNHSCHILIIMTRPRITYQWKNIYKYLFVFVYFLFTELGKQRIILNRIVRVRENFKHNLYKKKQWILLWQSIISILSYHPVKSSKTPSNKYQIMIILRV
jgi:hypothetical protein